jgi:hypothetical protein
MVRAEDEGPDRGGTVKDESIKLVHCIGCEDNFYNGNNNLGVDRCWSLDNAKLMKRKKVGMNDRPPWTWKPGKYLSCYRQRGYVFIDCEKQDRQR